MNENNKDNGPDKLNDCDQHDNIECIKEEYEIDFSQNSNDDLNRYKELLKNQIDDIEKEDSSFNKSSSNPSGKRDIKVGNESIEEGVSDHIFHKDIVPKEISQTEDSCVPELKQQVNQKQRIRLNKWVFFAFAAILLICFTVFWVNGNRNKDISSEQIVGFIDTTGSIHFPDDQGNVLSLAGDYSRGYITADRNHMILLTK